MAPEKASVRGVEAPPNRSGARFFDVDSFLTLRSFYDTEFHCLTFSYAPHDLLQVVLTVLRRHAENAGIFIAVEHMALTHDALQ